MHIYCLWWVILYASLTRPEGPRHLAKHGMCVSVRVSLPEINTWISRLLSKHTALPDGGRFHPSRRSDYNAAERLSEKELLSDSLRWNTDWPFSASRLSVTHQLVSSLKPAAFRVESLSSVLLGLGPSDWQIISDWTLPVCTLRFL